MRYQSEYHGVMSTWAGNIIRIARTQQNLTQRELARRAGTSQTAIAAYEAGRRSPTLDTLSRVIRAAGLDLRIRIAPHDDSDEWLRRYEAALPPEVVSARLERDRELLYQAQRESTA